MASIDSNHNEELFDKRFDKIVDGYCEHGFNVVVDATEEELQFLEELLDLVDELKGLERLGEDLHE